MTQISKLILLQKKKKGLICKDINQPRDHLDVYMLSCDTNEIQMHIHPGGLCFVCFCIVHLLLLSAFRNLAIHNNVYSVFTTLLGTDEVRPRC